MLPIKYFDLNRIRWFETDRSLFKLFISQDHTSQNFCSLWSTNFSAGTWTLTGHDDESRRLPLTVKRSWDERVQFASRFVTSNIVLLVPLPAKEPVVFWVASYWNWITLQSGWNVHHVMSDPDYLLGTEHFGIHFMTESTSYTFNWNEFILIP